MFCLNVRYGTWMIHFLGEGDMVYSFFSTISKLLEPKGWGTRFPIILRHLCDYGCVKHRHLTEFIKELTVVKRELRMYKIVDALYDYEYPEFEIPFEKTEYYSDQNNLDMAYCACDEYRCESFTDIMAKEAKDAFLHNTDLVLAECGDYSIEFPESKLELYKDVWLKRGRGYYKHEYPIIFKNCKHGLEDLIKTAENPEYVNWFKKEYDRRFLALKKRAPIVFMTYIPEGVKTCSKADIQRFKEALSKAFQTDYFKVVLVDDNNIEENPNKPLDYTKWKGEV